MVEVCKYNVRARIQASSHIVEESTDRRFINTCSVVKISQEWREMVAEAVATISTITRFETVGLDPESQPTSSKSSERPPATLRVAVGDAE
jgi:hypothetical protein